MSNSDQENLVSSKEILQKTNISRATLNNYIRIGIIPKPVVMRPRDGTGRTKKIGYFPRDVIERIQDVKHLKKQGLSMEQIGSRFRESWPLAFPLDGRPEIFSERPAPDQSHVSVPGEDVLRLTLDSLAFPAYLLTSDFTVSWSNRGAMKNIFMQNTGSSEAVRVNVFKWLFHWELHDALQNWKDLLSLHISYAKSMFGRSWFQNAYPGISDLEIEILSDLYDRASLFPEEDIHESHINFLKHDNTTESYRVFTMSFREGRLFVYLSSKGIVPC